MRVVHTDAPKGHGTGGREVRGRTQRYILLAFVLTAPALCLAQETGSATPTASAPATGGVPAAEFSGATLPSASVPIAGLTGAAATGLTPMPAEYTDYGASVGLGGTDNVNASATDRKAQALAAANLFFDLIRTGSRLEMNAVGNFSDIDYLEHAYGNQLLGRFDGFANLTLWKRHLNWVVRDDFGDSQIDVLQALRPINVQRINVFSTGPDLMLQPTISSFVELQGLYSRNTYQDSPFSGNSETGTFTLGHQLSPSATISLVGQIRQERFDNTSVNANYQVRQYYGHYAVKGARTAIDLQGGLDQANDRGSWESSPLVRLSITRNVSPFSSISLSGGRDYNNAMGSFASLAASATGGIPVASATQTTANALQSYGNVAWGFHRLRTTINLSGGWERNSYDRQSIFDVDRTDVSLSLGRQLTRKLSADIIGTVDRSRYTNQGFTQNYGTAGGGLVYRPGAWIVIYGRYDHQFLHATGVTRGLGYDENRVYVMIGYYPHSSGTGAPGEGGMGEGGIM